MSHGSASAAADASAADRTERLRRRAYVRILPALGPRWVLVAASGAEFPSELEPRASVIVAAAAAAEDVAPADEGPLRAEVDRARTVRGAAAALPVLSEAATGVLVLAADGTSAERTVREAARLLQPGGVAVFVATWPAESVAAFDGALGAAGLERLRRFAIRRASARTSGLAALVPWIEQRRAAASHGAALVECAVVARRPGPDPALPTTGSLLAEMFVPRAARRSR